MDPNTHSFIEHNPRNNNNIVERYNGTVRDRRRISGD